MKRLTCLLLCAIFIIAPCRKSQAPITIVAELAIKCLTISGLGGLAIMIYRCSPDYYLVRYQLDGEIPNWACSQASAKTLAKTGGRRCEGPWKERTEPDFRAWANNKDLDHTMFPCGPLGTIPGPVGTNYNITLQSSTDGGKSYVNVASTVADPGDNYGFACLSAGGTNGMAADQLQAVRDCDVAVTNTAPSSIFRVQFQQ